MFNNNMPEDAKEKVLGERDSILSIVRKCNNENVNPKKTIVDPRKGNYEQAI